MRTTHQVKIQAIHTVVPSTIERTMDLPFDKGHLQRVCDASGIKQRHIADNCSAFDLALAAAQNLLNGISSPSEIGAIVYVTQTPQTTIPSEAHLLQDALGLSQETTAITITEGCAGYVYGLQTAASLVSASGQAVLLVVADTVSKLVHPSDSSSKPLFGDAAAATLVMPSQGDQLEIITGSDGGGAQHIMLNEDILRMDGMEVFMFGIRKVPKLIAAFLSQRGVAADGIDYLVLHQANKMMIDRIGKKLGFNPEQIVKSLGNYGNTSAASIPLAITDKLSEGVNKPTSLLLCGFGAGLAWGMATCTLDSGVELGHAVL